MPVCIGFKNYAELFTSRSINIMRALQNAMLPAFSTVGIYTFLQSWNELMFAAVFISREAYKTLPVGIQGRSGQYSTERGPIGAALAMAAIPALTACLFLSRQIQDSFTAGAVKG